MSRINIVSAVAPASQANTRPGCHQRMPASLSVFVSRMGCPCHESSLCIGGKPASARKQSESEDMFEGVDCLPKTLKRVAR
jgi:hypothetical protein